MKNSNLIKRVSVAVTVSLATVVAVWAAAPFTVTATIENCNGICNGTNWYTLQSDGSTSATYAGGLSPDTHGGPDYYQLDLSSGRSRSFYLTLDPLDSKSANSAPFPVRCTAVVSPPASATRT